MQGSEKLLGRAMKDLYRNPEGSLGKGLRVSLNERWKLATGDI